MATALIPGNLNAMRAYFETGVTRSYQFRLNQLARLKKAVMKYEQSIYAALYTDLKKSPEETWVTENGFFLSEINNFMRNLRRWMQPDRTGTNLVNLPSSSYVLKEPLGVVLIISPWNYPFQLLFTPFIGAIAAGNCVVLKPSEFAPATSAVMKKIIEENFSPEYVLYAEGDGHVVVPALMNSFTFNHVFYTGSTTVGKYIYKMAAEKLVPVTLELGGKSPCIVEKDANIDTAARRIVLSKFSNAGQMCVTPDYVLVHESRSNELLNALKKAIVQFFGERPEESYNYGKIVNERQFDRIKNYLSKGEIFYGGRTDRSNLFIEPTIVVNPGLEDPVMNEEIFGPVLPVLRFHDFEEAKGIVERNPDPLAFYVFTAAKKTERKWLENVSFGGGCVNNAAWHLTNHNLPFGGRGSSGIGNYHGRFSFDTFSHKKAIMKTPNWFDPAIKYPPFKGKLNLFKWIIR